MDGETPPNGEPERDIANEVSAILAAGGFAPMPQGEMKGLLAKECVGGVWMGGVYSDGAPYSKHTMIDPATTCDPIEAAHDLVAHAKARAYTPPDETALPSDLPAEPDPEPLSGPEPQADAWGVGASGDDAGRLDAMGGDGDDGGSGAADAGDVADAEPLIVSQETLTEHAFDADFGEPEADALDLGEVEDYRLDPLLIEDEAAPESEAPATDAPGSQFIFGDNLDQMRTAAIGLVMRHARTLMPFWTTDHDAALVELRNHVMGAAEDRWDLDQTRQTELEGLETTLRRITAITTARDAKVEFLESASREEIAAFDYAAGWP